MVSKYILAMHSSPLIIYRIAKPYKKIIEEHVNVQNCVHVHFLPLFTTNYMH